jgi:glutathione S-transferase
VLGDSQLIAEYLEQCFVDADRASFLPVDAWEAAQVRMWLALEAGSHKEFRPLFWLHVIRPELQKAGVRAETVDDWVASGVSAGHRQWLRNVVEGSHRFDSSPEIARKIVRRKLALLEAPLAGRSTFVGDTLTLADLAWYTRIDLLPQLGIELEPSRHANLLRWFAGIRERLAGSDS